MVAGLEEFVAEEFERFVVGDIRRLVAEPIGALIVEGPALQGVIENPP
ncbi:MAG: hypothetical protein JSV78_14100 [Phycisphaerales bacterium]|nr:MAG: hypothetical protein JSV78_14100 [Phycisphaerales bacterium]